MKQISLPSTQVIYLGSLLLLLTASLADSDVFAQTLVVNSVGDAPDLVADGVCDTGATVGADPECTLRAAVQENNAGIATIDNIHFNISQGCVNGICTIQVTTVGGGFIPDIRSPVGIDGSTQPGNAAVCSAGIPNRSDYRIVLEGDSADIGLRLEAGSDGSVIRGLNLRNFFNAIAIVRSNNNRIECNFVGTDESGTLPGPGNAGSAVILGCDSSGNVIGGPSPADGNLLSANASDGVQFFAGLPCAPDGAQPTQNAVLGNFIGAQKDGVTPLGNTFSGISFFGGNGADDNFVGVLQNGTAVNGNVIGANASGVFIGDNSDAIRVVGNAIGTDQTGTVNIGNSFAGIEIVLGSDNQIGGSSLNQANTIAFNGTGVFVTETGSIGNRIQRNNTYSNVGLGIDLVETGGSPDGSTPNDIDDTDVGGNTLQNFPQIASATEDQGLVSVEYSVPAGSFPLTVEFFNSDGARQGRNFLAEASYTGSGTANASFPDTQVNLNDSITATATDSAGNTSEFAAQVAIVFLDLLFRDGFEANDL